MCRARLPGADVRVAAAEELPFEDDSFDGAFAQLVVNFMTDAERGVGEMKRVVKPGGTVAACTWDYRGRDDDAARVLGRGARGRTRGERGSDEGSTMRYATLEELTGLWRTVGLDDVDGGELWVTRPATRTSTTCGRRSRAGSAPPAPSAPRSSPERQEALRAACVERLGDPEGPFELPAREPGTRSAAPSPNRLRNSLLLVS